MSRLGLGSNSSLLSAEYNLASVIVVLVISAKHGKRCREFVGMAKKSIKELHFTFDLVVEISY